MVKINDPNTLGANQALELIKNDIIDFSQINPPSDTGVLNSNQFTATIIKIDFSHIIGNTDAKEEIEDFLNESVVHYDDYREYLKLIGAEGAHGLLLYGLPGIGKSMFLRAVEITLLNHPDIDVIPCSRSSLMGTVGNNALKIEKVFNDARSTKKKMCIMLIDEADGLMAKRGKFLNADERTGEFITQLQGTHDSSKLLVIATTNDLRNIDGAVIDRFTAIKLSPPTNDERKLFIMKYIACLKMDVGLTMDNIGMLVANSQGFTGRNYMTISIRLKAIEYKRGIITNQDISTEFNKFAVRASIVTKSVGV